MSSPPGSLRWRCRRGTKELDVLLERYVNGAYASAPPAERQAFEQLLELPDPVLTEYFMGYLRPAEPAIAELIARIAPGR